MSVKLTSPVLGQDVDFIYTGPLETWLLAEGYAKRDADTAPTSYSGIGVSNTGVTADTPANDPTSAANREAPYFPSTPDRNFNIANDAAHLNLVKNPAPGFDMDVAGVDTEAPSDLDVRPRELAVAGGNKVTITGTNLENVTSVTFGGTAGTALDVSEAGDGVITVVSPAKAAGTYDVVLVDASGNGTKTGGALYA